MTRRPRDGRDDPHAGEPDPEPAKRRAAKGDAAPHELDLWRYTMRAVKPLKKAKPRVPEVGAPADVQPKPRPAIVKPPPPPTRPPAAIKPAVAKAPKPAAPKTPPPLVTIERRKARKIARGHVEIDARIDLHGLRQADAERRLRAFLLSSRAEGLRTVLVITGKGSARGADDHGDSHERSARGVLRRSVPLWLEQPELRDCVAGIAPAHIRHGGDGALYIHLRKRR